MRDPQHVLTDLSFSPVSDRIACATHRGVEIRTWPGFDLVRAWTASSPGSRKVRFHPDGRRLAVTHLDAPLVVLDVEGDGRVELAVEPPNAIAYDAEGSLYAHDSGGVMGWMAGSTAGTRLTEHTRRADYWTWDTLLLPRRKKTLYGRNDEDGLMLDWTTGEVVTLHAWLDPLRPRGASIFSLAANGDETCIAFGGKHPCVNVVRTTPAFAPLSCEERWLGLGGRCVILAHHPRRSVLAAVALGGKLGLFEPVTWDRLGDAYTGFGATYPGHGS